MNESQSGSESGSASASLRHSAVFAGRTGYRPCGWSDHAVEKDRLTGATMYETDRVWGNHRHRAFHAVEESRRVPSTALPRGIRQATAVRPARSAAKLVHTLRCAENSLTTGAGNALVHQSLPAIRILGCLPSVLTGELPKPALDLSSFSE